MVFNTLLLRTFSPHQRKEPQFHHQVPMLPLVYLNFSPRFLLSLEETFTGMCPIIVILWLVFFNRFLQLQCKNTGDKRSLFCYARRHCSICISNIILKVLVECRHIQITAEYLSMSQKSSQVSRVFVIFTKLFARQMNVFP